MTVIGFIVLLIVAGIVGAVAEAVVGWRPGGGWVTTVVVGLLGAWIGTALIRIGPVIGGVYLISAIIGAIVLVFLLKMLFGRRAVT